MIAIVLVGGKHPAPLTQIAGEPFLYWLTQWLKTQGFTHIVFSASLHADKITAWVNQYASFDSELCLDVITESRPLGTAGAAALCAKRFPSTYSYIFNGNSILLTNLSPAIQKLKQNPDLDGIILGTPIPHAGRFGALEVKPDHRLVSFKEKQPGNGPINAGIYLLKNELLSEIVSGKELSLEFDCFPLWLNSGKYIEVIEDTAPFIDIATPESLKKAQEQILHYQSIITDQKEFLIA